VEHQHPTDEQRAFLAKYVLGQQGMVLTVKATTSGAWASCNLRGPFRLSDPPYRFPGKEETVLEPVWATRSEGEQESAAHLHIPWQEVAAVSLTDTNTAVRENIRHDYQLTFYDHSGHKLFWFYINNERHPAVEDVALRKLVKFSSAG
jgi:hypothetical protein